MVVFCLRHYSILLSHCAAITCNIARSMDSGRRINKEYVTTPEDASWPPQAFILQVRSGKVKCLGTETSGIFKEQRHGPQFTSTTGLSGDKHVYRTHGGIDRAVHQYAAQHYHDWRRELPPRPERFDFGVFGENICATDMDETNVCIGDLSRVGEEVVHATS